MDVKAIAVPSVGSVWIDRDKRETGRKLVVEDVADGYVIGISRERRVSIRLNRFHRAWLPDKRDKA